MVHKVTASPFLSLSFHICQVGMTDEEQRRALPSSAPPPRTSVPRDTHRERQGTHSHDARHEGQQNQVVNFVLSRPRGRHQ